MKSKISKFLSYITGISALLFVATFLFMMGSAMVGHPVEVNRETFPRFIPGLVGFFLMFPSTIIRNSLRVSEVNDTFSQMKEVFPGGTVEEFKEVFPKGSPMAGPFEGLLGEKIWNLKRTGKAFKLHLGDGSGGIALYRRQEISQKRRSLGKIRYCSSPMTEFTVVNEMEAQSSGSGYLGMPNPQEYLGTVCGKPPFFPDSVTVDWSIAKEMMGDWQAYVDSLGCTEGYRQLLLAPQVRDAILRVIGKNCNSLGIVIGRSIVRIYHLEPEWMGKNISLDDCRMFLKAAMDIARERDAVLARLGYDALNLDIPDSTTPEDEGIPQMPGMMENATEKSLQSACGGDVRGVIDGAGEDGRARFRLLEGRR